METTDSEPIARRTRRSIESRGKQFKASIHVYKTYLTRRVHADELIDGELNSNPMALAASKADDDTMYLHQARKEHDWKDFERGMQKEIKDHQEREHWTVMRRDEMPKGTTTMKSVWSMK